MALKTDYTDAAWTGNRKYNMIENSDGTVSFEDVTEYTSKENSFFGASDANAMNTAVNTATTNIASLQLDKLDKSTITTKTATASNKTISTGKYTNICSISLAPGTWVVRGVIQSGSASSGDVCAIINTTAAWKFEHMQKTPISTGGNVVEASAILDVTATTTYYLVVYQNSGASLSIQNGYLEAVRLK